MKKALFVFGSIVIYLSTTSSSCSKDPLESEVKDYTCKCTYVPPDSTTANKEETSIVKGENFDAASIECKGLNSKYYNQFYSGSCVIQ